MLLSIGTHRTPTTVRLDLTGELDMSTAGSLSRAITAALDTGPDDIVINLDGATFCDCAGITALLNGRQDALARQVSYRVRNAHGNPLRVLRALGLHTMLST
jgi:anti-sigma B factor antagonist